MIHLILFGPPGSGKGTQAEKLIKKYNLFHISTGDLFRAETSRKTPLGLKALEYMSQGMLVPDEITIGMLKNKLSELNHVSGIIYDGFPRTIAQAEALDKLLAGEEEEIRVLVALEVPDDEIVSRILKRGATSGRSDDNDESIIRKRMEEYRQKTSEVFNYYDRFGKSRTINGLGTIDEIFDRICAELDQHI
ncbi:MAG TPA: adenylate kinase [Bacteroidales bacterium]|nr:adenylate kinase [Bacteroidales bacterium]